MTLDRPRGWWRENRLWLVVLPLALVAALAASSYGRAQEFWYDLGPHDRIARGERGEFVEATSDYQDALGPTTRSFAVRLAELEEVDDFPYDASQEPEPPPEGLQPVAVHLDWRADPDQVLSGCQIALVDEDGRGYEVIAGTRQDVCVPFDQRGPQAPVSVDEVRGQDPLDAEPRPPEWSTAPVVLVPEGREITRVLVWWQLPQFVALDAS